MYASRERETMQAFILRSNATRGMRLAHPIAFMPRERTKHESGQIACPNIVRIKDPRTGEGRVHLLFSLDETNEISGNCYACAITKASSPL